MEVINFLLISIVSIVLKGIKGLKMDLVQIFFHVSAQLITPYLHMKFQVNILSGSGIERGDRPTDHPSNRPTDIVEYRRSVELKNPAKIQ